MRLPPELPRWGKCGERLTEHEARTRLAQQRKKILAGKERRRRSDALARRRWSAGLVVPHNITMALDLLGLEGPEVDIACGTEEPAVDLWEEAKLYPTWEQLGLLAKLTQKTAYLFTVRYGPLTVYDTSMRFHMDLRGYAPQPPILRYSDEVVRRCPGTNVDDPMRLQP